MRISDWSSDVCSSDLPEIFVLAGEDLIETVLENIFDNAIEVSPNGSKIIVELRSVQGRAELSVLDRGPGVPHGELTRIFERSVPLRSKLKASERAGEGSPHTGRGLWHVRHNLKDIGGTFSAEHGLKRALTRRRGVT